MHDDKHYRDRGRLRPGESLRRGHHLARVEHGEFGEPAGAAAHHPVAFLETPDIGAKFDNLARRVAAAGARLGRRLEPPEHLVQRLGEARDLVAAARDG